MIDTETVKASLASVVVASFNGDDRAYVPAQTLAGGAMPVKARLRITLAPLAIAETIGVGRQPSFFCAEREVIRR